jgi:hypothetical protein
MMKTTVTVASKPGTDGKMIDENVEVLLFGRRMHLLRAKTGESEDGGCHRGGIFLTDKAADETLIYEILALAPDCRYFTKEHIGGFVVLPPHDRKNTSVVGPGERIVNERIWDGDGESVPPLMVMFKED